MLSACSGVFERGAACKPFGNRARRTSKKADKANCEKKRVQAAAIAIGARVGVPGFLHLSKGIHAVGLRRMNARAAQRAIQQPAGRAPRRGESRRPAAHAAGGRGANCADRAPVSSGRMIEACRYVALVTISRCMCLTTPRRADQFGGQPVEQFGMRRRGTLSTKILVGFDQAAAKYRIQMRFIVTRGVRGF